MKTIFLILLACSTAFCYGHPMYVTEVSASSELADSQGWYPARNLIDRTWQSWAEGSKGNGVGESFTLTLPENNDRPVAGFALKNGYGNLDYYSRNNRVKSFRIFIDGNYIETIAIKDSFSFEQYALKKPVEGRKIRFVIDDVYPGTIYNDTCISEVALLSEIVSDQEFYENILFWLRETIDDGPSQFENNSPQLTSVSDADKIMLLDYLPFDIPYFRFRTKIALLSGSSSLKLNNDLPRIDGATAMYPLYSAFVHAVYPEKKFDELTEFSDYTLLQWGYFPSFLLWKDYSGYFWAEQELFESIVQCNTTSEAYRRLIDGETDIIFCYEPSEAEISAAAAKGKHFNLTPVCKDAFVFIVNDKNVIRNITLKQIRDIYSGRVTNWKSISGVDEPIIAYQRSENSGSQTTLQSIMKGEQLIRPIIAGEYVSKGMFGMIRKIASDYYNYNSAIGYTFLFYVNNMAGKSGIKALSIDGSVPDRQNIVNNTYPFCQTVYAVTTGSESYNTKKFIEWILSPQGQELVEKTGYIPLK